MDIKGKVILITGASMGIGLAAVRKFAEGGAKLALLARSADVLERLADELNGQGVEAIAVPADLLVAEEIDRAIEQTYKHFGRIDILINNAGQAAAGTIADVNPDHFRQIMELNVFSPLLVMQKVIPIMRKQGGGIIMNISSMVTKMRIPALAAYASTKCALNMLSDTARIELAPDNIRVISVFPRLTATDFHTNSLGSQEPRQRQRINPSVPIDTAEHVANKIYIAAINEPDEQYMDI